jgi:hypothetical protein
VATVIRGGSGAVALIAVALVALAAVAVPVSAAPAGVGDATVAPAAATTGETVTLDLSVNATGVNTSDGSTAANVTATAPGAIDLSGATVTARGATPNATGVGASIDADANAVTVSWDDDAGTDAETVRVTATLADVAVARSGDHDLTATVDADGDGATDAHGTVGTITASATGSDRSVTRAGGVLYLGESDVDLTGLAGTEPAGSADRFYGVGGEATGTVAVVEDTVAADVTLARSFAPGKYALEDGGESVFVVQRPNVTDVDLYPGTATSGTEVAGSSIPVTVETLTVAPRFDFDATENATVVVETESGLTITEELTDDPTASGSGEPVRLDVSDLSVGTYTVRVEGADDLDHVTGSATVRVRESARTVSLSRTRVTRGEETVATVSGEPGTVRYLRIPADALRDGESVTVPTATAVFGGADGLAFVGANAQADVLYAVLGLDDEGFARVELDTERLVRDTHKIDVARNATADAVASVPVTVTARDVSASPERGRVAVGETVTVSGTAAGADTVKLYAQVGGEYAPLHDDESTLAEPRVDDGAWSVDVETTAPLSIPGEYRIVAVANPGDASLGSSARIDEATLRAFDDVATTRLTTVDPSPSVSLSRSRISTAEADEVAITGRSPGPGETVRRYVVSPRGDVDADTVSVDDDDAFDDEYADFGTPGTYRVVVVTPGRDDTFGFAADGDAAAVTRELSGAETRAEATAILRDAYGGAGVDDQVLVRNVTATSPRVTVETVTHDGDLTVIGTVNRENGTVVSLELRNDSDVVAVGDAEVNGSGRWTTTLAASRLAAGTYTLSAAADEASDVRQVRLGAPATPSPTTESTPTDEGSTVTAVSTAARAGAADADGVGTETGTRARASETAGAGDGFGAVIAVLSLLGLAALLASRRRP